MQKISHKKLIQVSIVLLVVLLGIFSFYIKKNTENKQQESSTGTNLFSGSQIENGSTDSNKISGPRGGQPDTEIILKSVSPSGVSLLNTTNTENIQTDSISLIAGDINVNLKITAGQTLYDVLQNEENSKLIIFTGKKYTGIGFFVTDIGNLHQGDGKYLMYDINGREASSGISDYVPKNGDIVEWKLK